MSAAPPSDMVQRAPPPFAVTTTLRTPRPLPERVTVMPARLPPESRSRHTPKTLPFGDSTSSAGWPGRLRRSSTSRTTLKRWGSRRGREETGIRGRHAGVLGPGEHPDPPRRTDAERLDHRAAEAMARKGDPFVGHHGGEAS